MTKGELPFSLNFPLILGHEPADEIVDVGEGVTTRKKGDRVWCTMGTKRIFQ
ncbi:MAG: alcohol dehydrogenase catalytic domain-containing protein [Nitrososphaeraceae archaeon]